MSTSCARSSPFASRSHPIPFVPARMQVFRSDSTRRAIYCNRVRAEIRRPVFNMSVKQLAKRAIDALGYEVSHRVKSKVVGGKHYGPVRPVASYSPWLDNADFSAIFDLIKPNTLVDRFRCYELWELVSQVGHLPGNLLEVGVWRGGTAALICRRAKELAKKPTVYLCDTFTGVCKATDKDSSYSGGEHADTSEQVVLDLLSDLGCENFKRSEERRVG